MSTAHQILVHIAECEHGWIDGIVEGKWITCRSMRSITGRS